MQDQGRSKTGEATISIGMWSRVTQLFIQHELFAHNNVRICINLRQSLNFSINTKRKRRNRKSDGQSHLRRIPDDFRTSGRCRLVLIERAKCVKSDNYKCAINVYLLFSCSLFLSRQLLLPITVLNDFRRRTNKRKHEKIFNFVIFFCFALCRDCSERQSEKRTDKWE